MATGYEEEIIGALLDEMGDDELDSFASGLDLESIAIGSDEIVGAENDNDEFLRLMSATSGADIVPTGPMVPTAPTKSQALQKLLLARQVDPGAVALVKERLSKRRFAPLGFEVDGHPDNIIPAGETGTATARPQKKYRIEKIKINSSIAPYFVITGFSIGVDNQFVSKAPVPASMFTEVSTGKGVLFGTAEVGNDIVFTFRSISDKPRMFLAGVEGTMIR